jgi:hypothetical protein
MLMQQRPTWSTRRSGRVPPGPAISNAMKVRSLLLPGAYQAPPYQVYHNLWTEETSYSCSQPGIIPWHAAGHTDRQCGAASHWPTVSSGKLLLFWVRTTTGLQHTTAVAAFRKRRAGTSDLPNIDAKTNTSTRHNKP